MANLAYNGVYKRQGCDPFCFYIFKDQIIQYHVLFNNRVLNTKTLIDVIDSHYAYPHYDKPNDTIILDTHFFDILRIVSAAILTENPACMEALADLCTADYFICKDEILLAKDYSKSFCSNKELLIQAVNSSKRERVIDRELHIRQLLFVLIHEQGHGLLAYGSNEDFTPYRIRFEKELETINSKTEYINSIDLAPIKEDLDRLDKSAVLLPSTAFDNYSGATIQYSLDFISIIEKGLQIVDIPSSSRFRKEEALYYACDQYIKQSNIKILDQKQYENECIIDGFALNTVLHNCINDDVATEFRMSETVLAYYSFLLTMNVITCVNACVMNYTTEGYDEEDLVWNRLRLESEIFHDVIKEYAFRKPRGFQIYAAIQEYSAHLADLYQKLYTAFCERVFSVKHPTIETPYYPCTDPEYDKLYDEVFQNLVLPIRFTI